jgi:uncharacterized protein YktB (UPF0637 family)
MTQLYNKATVSLRDQLIDDLGDRIDPYEIAARVVNAVEEEWSTIGGDMCLELWSIALDDLYTHLRKLARRLANPPYEN